MPEVNAEIAMVDRRYYDARLRERDRALNDLKFEQAVNQGLQDRIDGLLAERGLDVVYAELAKTQKDLVAERELSDTLRAELNMIREQWAGVKAAADRIQEELDRRAEEFIREVHEQAEADATHG